MASLVQYVNDGAINTIDTSTMGYYVIKFFSEAYTLKYDTKCDGQISSASELVIKAQYLSCIQENKNWYREKKQQQKFIIFPTQTIVHPCVGFVAVKDFHDIPRSVFNSKQVE